ncbi:MAG: hypothetical protein M0Z90_03665 [Desulfobacteraceae bacterium]|nr:hypothetical protein [Desulfobacteraceae bacterium]
MDPQDQAVLQQMFVQQAQDERKRREADEIQKRLVDMVTASYDRGAQYTTVVTTLGYAGFFTAWGSLKAHIWPRLGIWSLALVLISLFAFIIWEVYGAIYRDSAVMTWLKIYEKDPIKALENWKNAQVLELQRRNSQIRYLILARYMTLVPGLIGGGILIVGAVIAGLKQ